MSVSIALHASAALDLPFSEVLNLASFGVFKVVQLKNPVFWDVTLREWFRTLRTNVARLSSTV
jgi:hypothetical protein